MRATVLIACIAAITPAAARAEPAPPFAALLRQSADAPRLLESAAEVRRAEGLGLQATARPNPTIGVLTENVAGSRPFGNADRAETTVQFSQPIEVGGKRAARIAAGEAGVSAARARSLDTRAAYAFELARAYAAAEIADRRIELAVDEIEEAEADLRAATALVRAGKEARLRSLQAEAAVGALRADLDGAKAARIAAYARLSALAGRDRPYTAVSESLLDRGDDAIVTIDPLTTPAYRAADAERAAAERRATAERKRAIPDVTALIGVRRLNFEEATVLLGGVSIPLHLFDRNRGNIAAAQADLQAAAARLAMARYDAQAGAQAAAAQLAAAQARVLAAESSLRTAEEIRRLARIAYTAGKSPLIELLAARRGVGAARAVVLDARAARFEVRAGLARLQGRAITGEPIE